MAYGIKRISPNDLKPSTAIGVRIPFSATNVFTSVYTTKEQTKYNLINFLLTDNRERVFNPKFGANLRAQLFKQIIEKDINALEESIKVKIEEGFPNVNVVELNLIGDPDRTALILKFSYNLKNSNENDSVIITIQNA